MPIPTTVVVGGAAAALLWNSLGDGARADGPPDRGGGNRVPDPAAGLNAGSVPVGGKTPKSPAPSTGGKGAIGVGIGKGAWLRGDQEQQDRSELDAVRELRQKAADAYAKLTSEAKRAAAAEVNKHVPGAGLTGEESWDEASAKVSAAIGGLAGAAACNLIPIPGVAQALSATLCASLGAMIGAYLGGKLEGIGNWAEAQWGEVKQAFGTVEEAFDDVGDFLGLW